MTDLVPPEDIERIVGMRRHETMHIGRANSDEETVYILHSKQCKTSGIDLRDCQLSLALDLGIERPSWVGYEDRPVALGVIKDRLVPLVDLAIHPAAVSGTDRHRCGDPQCPDWERGEHFHDPWPKTVWGTDRAEP